MANEEGSTIPIVSIVVSALVSIIVAAVPWDILREKCFGKRGWKAREEQPRAELRAEAADHLQVVQSAIWVLNDELLRQITAAEKREKDLQGEKKHLNFKLITQNKVYRTKLDSQKKQSDGKEAFLTKNFAEREISLRESYQRQLRRERAKQD